MDRGDLGQARVWFLTGLCLCGSPLGYGTEEWSTEEGGIEETRRGVQLSEREEGLATPAPDLRPADAGDDNPLPEDTLPEDTLPEDTAPADDFDPWSLFAEPRDLSRLFDRAHRGLSSQLVETADAVDRFFGAERLDDDVRVAQIRLLFRGAVAENDQTEGKVRVRARIPFPRTKRRLQLAVDSLVEDTDFIRPRDSDEREDAESFAGLRYVVLAGRRGFAFFDVGGRVRSSVDPEVAIKGQRTGQVAAWRWRLFQSGFWNRDDHFGELTRLDLEREFGPSDLLRIRAQAEWTEESRGLESALSVGFVHVLDDKTAILIGGGVSGHGRPAAIVDEWNTSVRLRRQLHRRWLLIEIAPAARYPRERRYRFTPSISATLEILFGGETYREPTESADGS